MVVFYNEFFFIVGMKWNRVYIRYVIDRIIILLDVIFLRELNCRVILYFYIYIECCSLKLSIFEYLFCFLFVFFLLIFIKNGVFNLFFVKYVCFFFC